MNLLQMAFRNLGRKRSRTALSIIAVTIGVFVVVMTKSFIDGMLADILGNTIKLTSGHVRVIDREYEVKERLMSLNYPVDGFAGEGYQSMVEAIAGLDKVEYAVPRLRFAAMVAGNDDVQGVMAMGVDPAAEERLVHLSRYLSAGRLLKADEREVVMGYRMLEKLGLKVGDKFTLVFNTTLGSMRGYTFTVVGSLQSGLAYLDDGLVYLPLSMAQEMLDMGPAVTEVVVMGKNDNQAAAIQKSVQELLESKGAQDRYDAIPWYRSSGLVETMLVAKMAYNLIYALVLFLASFVVINTTIMVVNERRREIGMLSAMGLRPGEIVRLFLYEGGITSVIGSVVGVTLGSLMVFVLSKTGVLIEGGDAMDARIFLTPRLYPVFSLNVILFSLIAGILVTVVSIYGPARKAGKMEPTQALRA